MQLWWWPVVGQIYIDLGRIDLFVIGEVYKEEGVDAIMALSPEFDEAWAEKGGEQLRSWDNRLWSLYHQGGVFSSSDFSEDGETGGLQLGGLMNRHAPLMLQLTETIVP